MPMLNKPKFITFTGADEHTDIAAMGALASEYPIEWGILFSPMRQGTGRYPPLWWVEKLIAEAPLRQLDLAAHLCGGHSANVLAIAGTAVDHLIRVNFGRAQVNTSQEINFDSIRKWASSVGVSPILQCRVSFPPVRDVSWLFDASGGRGIEPKEWPGTTADNFVGYAGGLNPDNVAQHVQRISAVAAHYWIDMETGVRDESDRFDLGKCRAVCEAVYGKVGSAAYEPPDLMPDGDMPIEQAEHLAKLWRDGKMIGGDVHEVCQALLREVERLRSVLNTPELQDFSKAVVLEAAHQRERWGSNHDSGKEPADWFWLLGYLGGKALSSAIAGDVDKAKHHTISSAAAMANWHASLNGDSITMRPGTQQDGTV